MAKRKASRRRPAGRAGDDGASAGARRGGRLWIYGIRPALAALENPARRCRRLLIADEAAESLGGRLEAAARGAGVAAERVGRAALGEHLPRDAVHQGIAVEVDPLPPTDLDAVLDDLGPDRTPDAAPEGRAPGVPAVIVVLDRVTDPRNVGAVLRSAAAFGARAVVLPERHAPPVTPALAKAAAGALEWVPLVRVVNLARALARLKSAGFWCIGLAADGEATLAEIAGPARIALVLGAEGAGLRRLTRESCDRLARIPLAGPVAALNVSNAAAIALYEATLARARTDPPASPSPRP